MTAKYVDAAAILTAGHNPPMPARGGQRSDGLRLLYPGAVNGLVGDPESGKTLIASANAADELFGGGSVLWLDIDHNGPVATLTRLRRYGVSVDVLSDSARFRLAIPEDGPSLLAVIEDARTWRPTVAVLDSVGELLPMFGASSNSADEYTAINQKTLARLASFGIAVLGIDHMAKGQGSREYGAGGTVAKKRAIDGAYMRVTTAGGFSKGNGGSAQLSILKDRHGALRQASTSGREPYLTVFTLHESNGVTNWRFDLPAQVPPTKSDVAALIELAPQPKSVRDVMTRLGWGNTRAMNALRDFRGEIVTT
ncbi:hypothetical protein [Microbacterium sp.]|uniref:hypothetical protein n=1 Tax=Microbacterium sp. TaxID=51671 RepID=UPI002812256C|nr:hypothetical protein [Microbacterium sp.]